MKPYLLAFTLITGLGLALCSAPKRENVIAFNDKLVAFLKTSQVPFEAYWDAVAPWYNAKTVDMKPVFTALAQIEATHHQIYEKLLQIEVPDGEICEEFYEAVMEYFSIDREVIAALKSATTYISENNPAVGQEDLDHVDGLTDPILERREAVFERVESIQQRLAEKHVFSLK